MHYSKCHSKYYLLVDDFLHRHFDRNVLLNNLLHNNLYWYFLLHNNLYWYFLVDDLFNRYFCECVSRQREETEMGSQCEGGREKAKQLVRE
jgi:hypothetical protein